MVRATGNEVIAADSEINVNIERDMAVSSGYLSLKRVLDIIAASALLIVSFIPFLIIALLIK